jgi:penicillin-binding protein 2
MQFGGHFAKCTGSHGMIGLSDALMRSCNGFFYRYGIATGIKSIDLVGDWFNLGQPTGIELPREDGGLLPSPDESGASEAWSEAQTAFTSIGQGQVLTTPLQMCSVVATVAHGRHSYRPRLLSKTYDHAEKTETPNPPRLQADLVEKGATPQDLELVRKGLWKVVNGEAGTARGIKSKEYEIAGKTGTAQAWLEGKSHKDDKNKDFKTWFIAFAPYENPKYALCVFVENGLSGGGTSAPIAARILKQAMAMDKGTFTPPLLPLPEAKGHFDHLERTVYADDPVDAAILAAAAANEEAAVVEAEPPATQKPAPSSRRPKAAAPQPQIKSRANAEGRSARTSTPSRPTSTPPTPSRLPKDPLLKSGQAR